MKKRHGDILAFSLIILAVGATIMITISMYTQQEIKMGKYQKDFSTMEIDNVNNLYGGIAYLECISNEKSTYSELVSALETFDNEAVITALESEGVFISPNPYKIISDLDEKVGCLHIHYEENYDTNKLSKPVFLITQQGEQNLHVFSIIFDKKTNKILTYAYAILNNSNYEEKDDLTYFNQQTSYNDSNYISTWIPGEWFSNQGLIPDYLYLQGKRKISDVDFHIFPLRLDVSFDTYYPLFYAATNTMANSLNYIHTKNIKRSMNTDNEISISWLNLIANYLSDAIFEIKATDIATENYISNENDSKTYLKSDLTSNIDIAGINKSLSEYNLISFSDFTAPLETGCDGFTFISNTLHSSLSPTNSRYVIKNIYIDEDNTKIDLKVMKEIETNEELIGFAEYLLDMNNNHDPRLISHIEFTLDGNNCLITCTATDDSITYSTATDFKGVFKFDGNLFLDKKFDYTDYKTTHPIKLITEKNAFILDDVLYGEQNSDFTSLDELKSLSDSQFDENPFPLQNSNDYFSVMASETVFMGDLLDDTNGQQNLSGSYASLNSSLWYPVLSEYQNMNSFGQVSEAISLEHIKVVDIDDPSTDTKFINYLLEAFDDSIFFPFEYIDTDFHRRVFYDSRFINNTESILLPKVNDPNIASNGGLKFEIQEIRF